MPNPSKEDLKLIEKQEKEEENEEKLRFNDTDEEDEQFRFSEIKDKADNKKTNSNKKTITFKNDDGASRKKE